jgi:hypothetical protein
MKVLNNMQVYHDNDVMLGEIYVDPVWNRVRFRAGKINTGNGTWCPGCGGTFDAEDLATLSKIMSGIQKSIDTKSFVKKIREQLG